MHNRVVSKLKIQCLCKPILLLCEDCELNSRQNVLYFNFVLRSPHKRKFSSYQWTRSPDLESIRARNFHCIMPSVSSFESAVKPSRFTQILCRETTFCGSKARKDLIFRSVPFARQIATASGDISAVCRVFFSKNMYFWSN